MSLRDTVCELRDITAKIACRVPYLGRDYFLSCCTWAAAQKLGRPRSDTAKVTWAGINAERAVRDAARVGVSDGREQRCEIFARTPLRFVPALSLSAVKTTFSGVFDRKTLTRYPHVLFW